MHINIPYFVHHHKFWFYFRKAIFQGFFPIFLALLTFSDFVKQTTTENSGRAYNHLYFYTSLILFLYAQMKIILEFIFAICAEDVIFKKEVNLNKTTSQLLLSFDMDNVSNDHFIVTIKKIYKLRYSNYTFFRQVDKLCWFFGLDSPILIPQELISKLTNSKNNIDEENDENEDALLHTTLLNLYAYHPEKYNSPTVQVGRNNEKQYLIPKMIITPVDKSINNMQRLLFNKETTIADPNV